MPIAYDNNCEKQFFSTIDEKFDGQSREVSSKDIDLGVNGNPKTFGEDSRAKLEKLDLQIEALESSFQKKNMFEFGDEIRSVDKRVAHMKTPSPKIKAKYSKVSDSEHPSSSGKILKVYRNKSSSGKGSQRGFGGGESQLPAKEIKLENIIKKLVGSSHFENSLKSNLNKVLPNAIGEELSSLKKDLSSKERLGLTKGQRKPRKSATKSNSLNALFEDFPNTNSRVKVGSVSPKKNSRELTTKRSSYYNSQTNVYEKKSPRPKPDRKKITQTHRDPTGNFPDNIFDINSFMNSSKKYGKTSKKYKKDLSNNGSVFDRTSHTHTHSLSKPTPSHTPNGHNTVIRSGNFINNACPPKTTHNKLYNP